MSVKQFLQKVIFPLSLEERELLEKIREKYKNIYKFV